MEVRKSNTMICKTCNGTGRVKKSKTLKKALSNCKFVIINPEITEKHFPMSESVSDIEKMSAMNVRDLGGIIDCLYERQEIENSIKERGYRSATLSELLIYTEKKWNGVDLIMALGSSFADKGMRGFPFIGEGFFGRELDLDWSNPGRFWLEGCKFLVIKNK